MLVFKAVVIILAGICLVHTSVAAEEPTVATVRSGKKIARHVTTTVIEEKGPANKGDDSHLQSFGNRNLRTSGSYWSAVLEIALAIATAPEVTDDDSSPLQQSSTDFSIALAEGEAKLYGTDSLNISCTQIPGYLAIYCDTEEPVEYSSDDKVGNSFHQANIWLFDSMGSFYAVLACSFCNSGECISQCVGMYFVVGSQTPSGCAVYFPDEQNPLAPCYNCALCDNLAARTIGANFTCYGSSPANECYSDPVTSSNPFASEELANDDGVNSNGDKDDAGENPQDVSSMIVTLVSVFSSAIPLFLLWALCKSLEA